MGSPAEVPPERGGAAAGLGVKRKRGRPLKEGPTSPGRAAPPLLSPAGKAPPLSPAGKAHPTSPAGKARTKKSVKASKVVPAAEGLHVPGESSS